MNLVTQTNESLMEDIKIKFDGDTHQIEANTLINSLLHFTNIIQEVNKELKTERKVEIKVNALNEGSFLVHLIIESNLINSIENLFTKENIEIASGLVTVVTGIYGLTKFLKGKKAKVLEVKGDTTKIENVQGNVTYIDNRVYNIYESNKAVRDSISQEFKTLSSDDKVTGFELLGKKDNPIVQIQKDEFADIASIEDEVLMQDERLITKVGMLNIVRLSFDKSMKWEFYYEGNKISAKMNDSNFTTLIDNGEQFAKGDSLEAEIEIHQEFHAPVNTFINKSYKVNKIIKHIPRPKQPILFDKKN